MEIYRLPRYRGNRWASCFYDCLLTILNNKKNDFSFIFLDMLSLVINVENINKQLYTNIFFDKWLDYSLDFYVGVNLINEKKIEKLFCNEYAIVQLKSNLWKYDEHYKDVLYENSYHFCILPPSKHINSENSLKMIDPYHDRYIVCKLEELKEAYIEHYFLKGEANIKYSTEELRMILLQKIENFFCSLNKLLAYLKFINGDCASIDGLESLAQEFADRMELFLTTILYLYKNFYKSSYYSRYIKIIIHWQNIRKVLFKKLDLTKRENKIFIHNEAIRTLISSRELFYEMRQALELNV
ncbi:hypothetical protein [Enterococcus cecorum]|uniref:hypothetical protein n=2 Tax=Enterococcus cecorum TaxID=44008 RepID=UPI00148E750D|nr:hypothetical protein [Enterococcus cecorum]